MITLALDPPVHSIVFDQNNIPKDLWQCSGTVSVGTPVVRDTFFQLFRKGDPTDTTTWRSSDLLSGLAAIARGAVSAPCIFGTYFSGPCQVYAQPYGNYDPASWSAEVTVDAVLPVTLSTVAQQNVLAASVITPPVSIQTSSGLTVPPAASLTDNLGAVWTRGMHAEVLRNGVDAKGFYAAQILWTGTRIEAQNKDNGSWSFWNGNGWTWAGR